MMQDWNAYRNSLLERVGDYAKQSPDLMRGLMMIDGAAAKTGHLEPKIHELISLAVAITTRCDGCISVPIATLRKYLQKTYETKNPDGSIRHYHVYISGPPTPALRTNEEGKTFDMTAHFVPF